MHFQITESQAAGSTSIEVKDMDGNVLISYTSDMEFKSIALSSPEMTDGESYTVYANGAEVYTVPITGNMTSISDTGEIMESSGGFVRGGYGRNG